MLEAVKLQEKLEGSKFGSDAQPEKGYYPWKKSKEKRILGHPRFINLTILTALSLQDVSLKRLTPALYEDVAFGTTHDLQSGVKLR